MANHEDIFSDYTDSQCIWLPSPCQPFLWISKAPAVLFDFLGVVEYQTLTISQNKFFIQRVQSAPPFPNHCCYDFVLYVFESYNDEPWEVQRLNPQRRKLKHRKKGSNSLEVAKAWNNGASPEPQASCPWHLPITTGCFSWNADLHHVLACDL